MYGYVYLILNKVTGKTYVGQHKSSNTWSKDTYMGSGKKMSKEYCENNRKAQKEYASRADYVNPASGRHWYTNGTVNVFTYECPIGYKPGMVRR